MILTPTLADNNTMKHLLALAVALILSTVAHADPKGLREFLDAIRYAETGGMKDNGIGAKGDNGQSYGPYQIQKAYWQDSKLKGTWEQCLTDKDYSEKVMIAYWKRYCPKAFEAGDWEVLARVHNGGPKGHAKKATVKYWEKVKARMEFVRKFKELTTNKK